MGVKFGLFEGRT